MKKVTPKGAGVKLNGKWCFIGQEEVISEEEYNENKEYLNVLEDIRETNERVIEITVKDETIDIEKLKEELEKYVENYNKPNELDDPGEDSEGKGEELDNDVSDIDVGDNKGNDNLEEDEELEALKEKAKKLGIKNIHNMKKETLIKKISEIE